MLILFAVYLLHGRVCLSSHDQAPSTGIQLGAKELTGYASTQQVFAEAKIEIVSLKSRIMGRSSWLLAKVGIF